MTNITETHNQQSIRLNWLLDTMIEQLMAKTPESALGGIKQYEDEAAALIESTGLANEAGIPTELRPVIQRTITEYDTDGLDEFAKLIEEKSGRKVEVTEESFPTCVAFRYITTGGQECASWFDWHATIGLGSGPRPKPPPGYKSVPIPPNHPLAALLSSGPPPSEPDERYIKELVACLMGWRALGNAPSAQGEVGTIEGGILPDPIENHDLATRCGYTDLVTMSDQIKRALSDAGQALPKIGRGGSLSWSHYQLKKALPKIPSGKLKRFLESAPI